MYFSSKDIPQLAEKTIQERATAIHQAQMKLTVPEKLILNLLKLILLIPPFIHVARQEWATAFLVVVVALVGYFLVFRPLSFNFLQRHLK